MNQFVMRNCYARKTGLEGLALEREVENCGKDVWYGSMVPCLMRGGRLPEGLRNVSERVAFKAGVSRFKSGKSGLMSAGNRASGAMCAEGGLVRSQEVSPTAVYQQFDLLGVEYLGPFMVRDSDGCRYILDVVDYFTRYTRAWATKKNDAEEAVRYLEEFDCCTKYGIESVVNPSGSTGMMQWTNRGLEDCLRKCTHQKGDLRLWPKNWPERQGAVNTRVIGELRYTLLGMLFGVEHRLPFETMANPSGRVLEGSNGEGQPTSMHEEMKDEAHERQREWNEKKESEGEWYCFISGYDRRPGYDVLGTPAGDTTFGYISCNRHASSLQ
ncbi:hypothetical protein BDZ91DRAFT_827853 [Kalaharituber pfeilii]|nr:hypothetical protein BDZ91DRAFT_827853 [Kalaharituber pfeilii]